MRKIHHFYTHLVEVEEIYLEIEKLEITKGNKKYLSTLVESSVHHTIVNAVLSELPNDQKKLVINHLLKKNHHGVWKVIGPKKDLVENKIKKTFKELKNEILKDIKDSKH